MGAVYKAQDRELERVIALKVIRPELASKPEILQRFKQELILARQVTDRNVIRIFDLGEAQGIRFITMEYVEGQSLQQILRQTGKLPISEAVDTMRQMFCGLKAAHREGIIHRDLKPGNVMRDGQGRVVIMGNQHDSRQIAIGPGLVMRESTSELPIRNTTPKGQLDFVRTCFFGRIVN